MCGEAVCLHTLAAYTRPPPVASGVYSATVPGKANPQIQNRSVVPRLCRALLAPLKLHRTTGKMQRCMGQPVVGGRAVVQRPTRLNGVVLLPNVMPSSCQRRGQLVISASLTRRPEDELTSPGKQLMNSLDEDASNAPGEEHRGATSHQVGGLQPCLYTLHGTCFVMKRDQGAAAQDGQRESPAPCTCQTHMHAQQREGTSIVHRGGLVMRARHAAVGHRIQRRVD